VERERGRGPSFTLAAPVVVYARIWTTHENIKRMLFTRYIMGTAERRRFETLNPSEETP